MEPEQGQDQDPTPDRPVLAIPGATIGRQVLWLAGPVFVEQSLLYVRRLTGAKAPWLSLSGSRWARLARLLAARLGRPARGFPPRLVPIAFAGLLVQSAPRQVAATARCCSRRSALGSHGSIVPRIGPVASVVHNNHHLFYLRRFGGLTRRADSPNLGYPPLPTPAGGPAAGGNPA